MKKYDDCKGVIIYSSRLSKEQEHARRLDSPRWPSSMKRKIFVRRYRSIFNRFYFLSRS